MTLLSNNHSNWLNGRNIFTITVCSIATVASNTLTVKVSISVNASRIDITVIKTKLTHTESCIRIHIHLLEILPKPRYFTYIYNIYAP